MTKQEVLLREIREKALAHEADPDEPWVTWIPELIRRIDNALAAEPSKTLPGGIPLAEFIAEVERDPKVKAILDAHRARLVREPDAERDGTGVRTT